MCNQFDETYAIEIETVLGCLALAITIRKRVTKEKGH